jgi:hypothetical protein
MFPDASAHVLRFVKDQPSAAADELFWFSSAADELKAFAGVPVTSTSDIYYWDFTAPMSAIKSGL